LIIKKILPILVVFILLSCFSACKKRYDGGEVGVGSVTIRLKGAQYSKNDLNLNNGKKASVSKIVYLIGKNNKRFYN